VVFGGVDVVVVGFAVTGEGKFLLGVVLISPTVRVAATGW
jgi:hypothetical protein